MKLDEFHIFNPSFGPVNHGNTIAGSNRWIGCCTIYLSITSGCKQRNLGKDLFNLIGFAVQYIYAITFNIGRSLCNKITQMMLRDQIDNKTMFDDFDITVL